MNYFSCRLSVKTTRPSRKEKPSIFLPIFLGKKGLQEKKTPVGIFGIYTKIMFVNK